MSLYPNSKRRHVRRDGSDLSSGPSLASKKATQRISLSENPIMLPFVASRARKLTLTSKSTQVMLRFGLRMAAILAFAVVGGIGFERGLTVMLWMSTILSAVIEIV